jgi:ferredoxin
MAFADELQSLYGNRVVIHDSSVSGRYDIEQLLKESKADVYACGPESLLSEIEAKTDPQRCHLERFNPVEREAPGGAKPVIVKLASSGRSVKVSAEESITTALKKAGVPVEESCGRGVCGTCELRVIEGEPLHLDSVMNDESKDKLGVFYPCVSRAKTPEITVDA